MKRKTKDQRKQQEELEEKEFTFHMIINFS